MVKIERKTFVYYHVYLLRDIKFTGYVANHFHTLTFTRQSQPYELIKKKNYSAYRTEKRLNVDYTFSFKLN